MNSLKWRVMALIFVFAVCLPVTAQETVFATNTPQITATPLAVNDPVEEPAASVDPVVIGFFDDFSTKDIVIIILVIALVFQSIRTQNLIPADKLDMLVSGFIGELRKTTVKTETKLDDIVLDVAGAIVGSAKPKTE
jgi:hypothetical protein